MYSRNEFPETGIHPLAPVEELAEWLLATAVHVGLGLAIGMIAARLLRSRHLHWSWSATALVPLALARPSLGGAGWTLAVAALSASLWGRRWHREDIHAGADLEEIAHRRQGPVDLLRSLAGQAANRRRSAREEAATLKAGELTLGRDEAGRAMSIPFGGPGGGTHTLVVGATGSGKTVTQSWMAVRGIEAGMAAIVLDPKGDGGMRSVLRRAALMGGRAFIEWTPEGPCVYNPYARGSETEIADKLLAGERFTEPHYMRQAQRHLGQVVRALHRTGTEVSLREIVQHLDPAQLEGLARRLGEPEGAATHAYLDSLTARQQSDLAGVRDRLAILAESDVGRWLDPRTGGAQRFDLLEAVRARAVVYFSLESDSRPLLSEMLGAAIVQDLQTTVAGLQGQPVPTLVAIDEFSAIAAEQVVRLFGRARSAGFSLLLGTQELSDLRLPGRERLLEQVMGNLSVLIAHRQVVPDSAELIASLAGTRGAWRTSRHSSGSITSTRTRASVLDPNLLLSLQRGWAAVIVLADGAGARIAQVFSPQSHTRREEG